MDDTVLFLSAYNSTQYKGTNWFLRKLRNVIPHKKKQMQSLLEKHHLSFVATDETITSVDGKMEVTAQYDYVHQATTFSFKSKDPAKKELAEADGCRWIETPEELSRFRFIGDATSEGAWIHKGMLHPEVRVAAPGIPFSLDEEMQRQLDGQYTHDLLEIGTAVMLGLAI